LPSTLLRDGNVKTTEIEKASSPAIFCGAAALFLPLKRAVLLTYC
jgi:hypothetical protein